MKVILLRRVDRLGEQYDIKNVSDGYARNFLIPRGLVQIATESKIKTLSVQRLEEEKKEKELKEKLEKLAEELRDRELEFYVKTGKKGEIFGSVTKEDIQEAILASISNSPKEPSPRAIGKFLISNENFEVNLEKPIKTIGDHVVLIELGRGIKTKIRVRLSEEKS